MVIIPGQSLRIELKTQHNVLRGDLLSDKVMNDVQVSISVGKHRYIA